MSTRIIAITLLLCATAGTAHAELVIGDTLKVDYVGPDGFFLHYFPDVVWSESSYHVAWADNTPGCETCGEYDLRSAPVSPQGQVGVLAAVYPRDGEDGDVAMAAHGSSIATVWRASGAGIYGGVGPGVPLLVDAAQLGSRGGAPAIASGPDGYLLVWRDDLALLAVHLDGDGRVIEGAPLVVDDQIDALSRVRVAHDDESFVVVWADGPNEAGLLARRVPDSGGALGPVVTISGDRVSDPDIAWDGTQLGVTFEHGGVQLYFLDAALAAQPGRNVTIRGGAGGEPAIVARAGGGFLVVYGEQRPGSERWGDYGIYAMRVAADGTLLDPGTPGVLGSGSVEVVNDPGWLEWHPRVARGEDGQYMVVWEGSVDRTPTISTTGVFAVLLEDEEGAGVEAAPPDDDGCAGGGTSAALGLALLIMRLARFTQGRPADRRPPGRT